MEDLQIENHYVDDEEAEIEIDVEDSKAKEILDNWEDQSDYHYEIVDVHEDVQIEVVEIDDDNERTEVHNNTDVVVEIFT